MSFSREEFLARKRMEELNREAEAEAFANREKDAELRWEQERQSLIDSLPPGYDELIPAGLRVLNNWEPEEDPESRDLRKTLLDEFDTFVRASTPPHSYGTSPSRTDVTQLQELLIPARSPHGQYLPPASHLPARTRKRQAAREFDSSTGIEEFLREPVDEPRVRRGRDGFPVYEVPEPPALQKLRDTVGRLVEALTVYRLWSFQRQFLPLAASRTLIVMLRSRSRVRWSTDGWKSATDTLTSDGGQTHWAVLPTEKLPPGGGVEFTFYWVESDHWEGRNFRVIVG